MLSPEQAAALEALTDERIGELPTGTIPVAVVEELERMGLLAEGAQAAASEALADYTTGRPIEWTTRTLTQGEILAAFARHCRDELDDVEVVEAAAAHLVLRWRAEVSRIELRAGFLRCERMAGAEPLLLLGDIDAAGPELVERFVLSEELRSRIAIYDLGRLEKIGAVRSSSFVYLEWFLRDEYGVKLLPAAAFTQGLIDHGVISLGFG